MNTLQVEKQNAIKAFNEADASGKAMLKNLFGEKTFLTRITDRVKTVKDAKEVLGIGDSTIGFSGYDYDEKEQKAIAAFAKLSIVRKALNEGWEPDWTNPREYKYFPWFDMQSGSGLSFYDVAAWLTTSVVDSRLCFKSRELAEYAGKQFIDLYKDLFIL